MWAVPSYFASKSEKCKRPPLLTIAHSGCRGAGSNHSLYFHILHFPQFTYFRLERIIADHSPCVSALCQEKHNNTCILVSEFCNKYYRLQYKYICASRMLQSWTVLGLKPSSPCLQQAYFLHLALQDRQRASQHFWRGHCRVCWWKSLAWRGPLIPGKCSGTYWRRYQKSFVNWLAVDNLHLKKNVNPHQS